MSIRRLVIATAVLSMVAVSGVVVEGAVLVADYRFEEASNLGLDSSGYGNNATVTGGYVGQLPGHDLTSMAAYFNGSGWIQKLSGLNGYDGLTGFTFAAWVRLNGPSSGYRSVIDQDWGGLTINRLLINPSAMPYVNVDRGADAALGSPLPYATWFFLTLTAHNSGDNRVGHVYVNGTEVGQVVDSGNLENMSGINTYIGIGDQAVYHKMGGMIDKAQIYNGALTAQEVSNLYQNKSQDSSQDSSSVPLPTALLLFAPGLLGSAAIRRKVKK